jgi:HAD superfamily hydrolase (TIGR01509 family)
MSIACILFDLGNVLLLHNSQRRLQALADFSGKSPKTVGEFLTRSGIVERLDLGQADEKTLAAALADFSGKPVPPQLAIELWLMVFAPNRELWIELESMERRHKLGVFSNNPPFIRQLFSKNVHFDHIFLSSQFGVMKPNMAVFRAVQAALPHRPEEILFVDDKRENIDQAFALGWNAIEFRSNEGLVREFARLGL